MPEGHGPQGPGKSCSGMSEDEEEEIMECPICGSTETVELHDERQSITICAECGAD